MTIHIMEYLERTHSKYENKVAIIEGDKRITFKELRSKAIAIKNVLKAFSISNSSPIAVYLPKSADTVICFAGILYSGHFYVPLDTNSPVGRIGHILESLEPQFIITNDTLQKNLLALGFSSDKIIKIETIFNETIEPLGIEDLFVQHTDTNPAYTLFTSGSTGKPKGVVVSHRSVIDYIDWLIKQFNIDETHIIGNQAPFFFDNSVFDIYLMMATGSTLVLIPEQLFMFPAKLLDYLNEVKVNMVFWVPSVLVSVANYKLLEQIKMPYLNKIVFAGEVMPTRQLNYWRQNVPHAMYINLYGPTEITVDCTYYIVDREISDDEPVPIGYPCRNSDVLILNEKDQLSVIGEYGELCVRGSSLALGYYNNPEKTEEVFVQNPLNRNYPEKIYRTGDIVYINENDEIIFVGRKDFQIKHMGYRIELGEIENAVMGLEDINNACVIYDNENKMIKLFFTASQDMNTNIIRTQLAQKIPKYMIPTSYTQLGEIPLTANGKVDRKVIQDII